MKVTVYGSWKTLVLLACLCLSSACSSMPVPSTSARDTSTAPAPDLDLEIGYDDALLVGAGDIADCGHIASALATGDLIRGFPEATVFTTGDNAYNNGTTRQFTRCYDRAWGSFKERTRPGGREVEAIQTELTTSDKYLDDPNDFGILVLALRANSYEWRFLKTDGTTGDTGSAECH